MNRKFALGACALLLVGLSACNEPPPCPTCPPPPPPPPKPDLKAAEEQIKALDAKWVEAVAAKDVDKVVAFYSDDASLLGPNEDEKTGDGIKEDWAGMVKMTNVALTWAPTRVEIDNDAEKAIDIGTYTMTFDDDKGKKVEDHGKYVEVWEKKGGEWKCAVDIYNSSVPMAPPPAAAPAPAPKKK
jgi:uncharacterized protein (TIGR02246 family)